MSPEYKIRMLSHVTYLIKHTTPCRKWSTLCKKVNRKEGESQLHEGKHTDRVKTIAARGDLFKYDDILDCCNIYAITRAYCANVINK